MERTRIRNNHRSGNRTLRDIAAAGFRRRKLVVVTFLAIFLVATGVLLLRSDRYEAEMKILVKRGRVDPMVSTDGTTSTALGRVTGVTEQDLSSEIELLRSRDLLEQAVADCRLATPKPGIMQVVFGGAMKLNASASSTPVAADPIAAQSAVRTLEQDLRIVPLRGSNLIAAYYESDDPTAASCVLNALSKRYVDKHLAVNRSAGTFAFFKVEADRYKQELADIESQLTGVGTSANFLTTAIEREMTARKYGDVSASIQDKKAAMAEIEARIRTLEQQAATLQDRHTTEIRTVANPRVADLKSTLTTLRMKRLELLQNYAPTYRTVQDVDRQIAEVQSELTEAERTPITEESTNRDPAYDYVRLELTKARSDLASMKAGTPVTASIAEQYRVRAIDLEKRDMQRQDLLRMAKVAEENYLLYLRKQEEARISEALDREHIVNVAIAQPANTPLVPTQTNMPLRFGLAAVLAGLLSLGTALGADYASRAFHRPTDIEGVLGVPTLAAYPKFDGQDTTIPQQKVKQ